MAIIYRTSDRIDVEEINPEQAPIKVAMQGSFVAPYLQFPYYDQDGKPAISDTQFAVFSSESGNLAYALIGSINLAQQTGSKNKVLRAFQVRKSLLDSTIQQLIKNKGVLDKEVETISTATDEFRYSPLLDMQKEALYARENRLPGASTYTTMHYRSKIDIANFNARHHMQVSNPGYALTPVEATELAEEIIDSYGLKHCRVVLSNSMSSALAVAACRATKPRLRLFDSAGKLEIMLHSYLPILRGILLHEFAHAIDVREFGTMSHGPTFVLLYAELLAKYTNLNFKDTLAFFNKDLRVANPVYSDQFGKLDRDTRLMFRNKQREIREKFLGDQ